MGTPLAFQATWVSTVVAAHSIDLAARARWRSFCAIILISTSRPCLLKRPALSASVSGAKPVQPDMPSTSLVFCACACACAGAARPSTHAAASASHFTTDLLIICSCLKKNCVARPGARPAGHDDRQCIPVYTGGPWCHRRTWQAPTPSKKEATESRPIQTRTIRITIRHLASQRPEKRQPTPRSHGIADLIADLLGADPGSLPVTPRPTTGVTFMVPTGRPAPGFGVGACTGTARPNRFFPLGALERPIFLTLASSTELACLLTPDISPLRPLRPLPPARLGAWPLRRWHCAWRRPRRHKRQSKRQPKRRPKPLPRHHPGCRRCASAPTPTMAWALRLTRRRRRARPPCGAWKRRSP